MNYPSSMDDQFLSQVTDIINQHMGEESFSVEMLSSKAGISRSMLHRKLIRLTGKSPGELITIKRLERSRELLENNVGTISEIAYKVGFSSPSYFNKVFKKHFQVAPGEVKRKVHLNDTKPEMIATKDSTPAFIPWHKKTSLIVSIVVFVILIAGTSIVFTTKNKTQNRIALAVLPIHNLTGSDDNTYLADGLHETLIGKLGQIKSIRVISRTSTLQFRDSKLSMKDIAKQLGVNTLIEGSLLKAQDSLRFMIQVIDVFPKERHILAQEYCDVFSNSLKMQAHIVKDISHQANIKLTKDDDKWMQESKVVNPETYQAYLRGMHFLHKGTDEAFEQGIDYLLQAIELDPADANAYAFLALGYATQGHGQLESEEAFRRTLWAANTALQIDPDNQEAHTALALHHLYNTWDWTTSKQAFENALLINPSNAIAHAHYAWHCVLFDEMEKSLFHAKEAVKLHPMNASFKSWLAVLYVHAGFPNEAIEMANQAFQLKENIPYGNYAIGCALIVQGKNQLALDYFKKLPKEEFKWKTLLGYAYVKADMHEEAQAIWETMEKSPNKHRINPCYRGMMASYLGYTDTAFELFNKAIDKKHYPITYIGIYHCTEFIKDDPRFALLLKKMNLPTPVKGVFANKKKQQNKLPQS
jgi:AraC-like DNA-binding protein/TolB-like protein/Tfp pilus assembly protein PilF